MSLLMWIKIEYHSVQLANDCVRRGMRAHMKALHGTFVGRYSLEKLKETDWSWCVLFLVLLRGKDGSDGLFFQDNCSWPPWLPFQQEIDGGLSGLWLWDLNTICCSVAYSSHSQKTLRQPVSHGSYHPQKMSHLFVFSVNLMAIVTTARLLSNPCHLAFCWTYICNVMYVKCIPMLTWGKIFVQVATTLLQLRGCFLFCSADY